jgi:hypothetical protein
VSSRDGDGWHGDDDGGLGARGEVVSRAAGWDGVLRQEESNTCIFLNFDNALPGLS